MRACITWRAVCGSGGGDDRGGSGGGDGDDRGGGGGGGGVCVPWCAAILMSLVNIIRIDSDSSSHWGLRENVFPGANPIREVVKSQCRELERRAGRVF